MSYLSLGLAVGTTVTLMMYFKIIHPPAAANPLIALFADVSLDYIIFPVMVGSIVIIILLFIIFLMKEYLIRDKISFYLMTPYLAWSSYALILNSSIFLLN